MRHTSLPSCSFSWCLDDLQPILFNAHLLPSSHLCCAIGICDTHVLPLCIIQSYKTTHHVSKMFLTISDIFKPYTVDFMKFHVNFKQMQLFSFIQLLSLTPKSVNRFLCTIRNDRREVTMDTYIYIYMTYPLVLPRAPKPVAHHATLSSYQRFSPPHDLYGMLDWGTGNLVWVNCCHCLHYY